MPYEWTQTAPEHSGAVSYRLVLWPHHSLPRRGFVWVIGLTAVGLAVPMLAVIGSAVLWGLLPFAAFALWALWRGIEASYHSGPRSEILLLSKARLHLTRSDHGRPDRIWQTNPYWVRVALRHGGPVEDYLILSDGRREVELGAFLSPEERRDLHDDLDARLAGLRG